MKKRIEQLLNGIFEYEPAKLTLTPQELAIHAAPGAVVHGSFRIECDGGIRTKGFLYSSSPRMVCEPVEFQGISNEIQYQLDCSGFEMGAQESGAVTVCCEQGEFTLPFTVTVESRQEEAAEQLPFEDLAGFAAFAHEDYARACRAFALPSFRRMLQEQDMRALALYDGLTGECAAGEEPARQCMEEFLTGLSLKEPVSIRAERDVLEWSGLSEPVQETLEFSRNTWGYGAVDIESDARFLRPEKKRITTEEFAGRTFDLKLVIDTNLMHAGNNYARIVIRDGCRTQTVEVTARRAGSREKSRQNHICKIMRKKLEGLYISFRLKKIDLPTWAERSVSVINSYRRAGGDDPFAELFLVQLYFADGKKQKAYQLLEQIEAAKERLDTPERYGFYLYMSTFFYREASYVDRVEEEIRRMYFRDKTNWKLFWLLMYLQESLLNDENARYEAIASQFELGCRSRLIYLEGWQILRKNPFLMRHIGSFELALLRFAAKEEILTAEVVRQISSLAAHHPAYDRELCRVLEAGFALYPSADVVKAVCLLLMKGDKKDADSFVWYARGVEYGLRVTGLYEYYMEAMDCTELQKMPQIIRMYFAYDTSLDYRKRAAVYRGIVENRESDAQTYRNYRAAIEKFALDQLEAMRISDDLAVLYTAFVRQSTLTRQMAEKLIRLLFTYEVTGGHPGLAGVVVHSARLLPEQKAAFNDGTAFVTVYDPDSVILAEDGDGRRYAAKSVCSVKKSFDNEEIFAWGAQKAPEHPGLVLALCARCLEEKLMNRNTLPYYVSGCGRSEFTQPFRDALRGAVLQYYAAHLRDESLPDFLEKIPYLEYVKVDKPSLIILLAEEGKCTNAFSLLDAYGAEGIPLLQLVRICSRMVLELEFEENTMLTALCWQCFASGKYDDKLLRYLLLYYEGPVRDMKQVWQAAVRFGLDTMLLEEKILTMLLFTRSGTQGSEPVFESYVGKIGRKKLCNAYANLKAYEYFVRGLPVAESVFQYIEKQYVKLDSQDRLDEQEEVCRLALLQHYAKKAEHTQEERTYISKLLEEFGAKGMRFAFWQCFDKELIAPYQMDGRVFVEYVGNPKSSVTLHYRLRDSGEEYREETVPNCFEGIFVREFTLFGDEALECWLEEDDGREKKKTDQWILTAPKADAADMTRFGMLCRIINAGKRGDTEKLSEELESYLMLEHLAREVFTLV